MNFMIKNELLVILYFATCLSGVISLYGQPCGPGFAYCNSGTEKCEDKICLCDISSQLYYDDGVAKCRYPSTSFFDRMNRDCGNKCTADQICKNTMCTCKNDSLVIANEKCSEPVVQNVMEKCYIAKKAFICNATAYTHCIDTKCLCVGKYYYDKKKSKCESKQSYMAFHGISSYKALPQEYCLSRKDCVEGLRCDNKYTCQCPYGCKYKEKDFICDCGRVSFETPISVVLTGVALGLVSAIFWACLIKRTVTKHRRKERFTITSHTEMEPVSSPPLPLPSDTGSRDHPPTYDETIANDKMPFGGENNSPQLGFGPPVYNLANTEEKVDVYNPIPFYPPAGQAPYSPTGQAPYSPTGQASNNDSQPASGQAPYPESQGTDQAPQPSAPGHLPYPESQGTDQAPKPSAPGHLPYPI